MPVKPRIFSNIVENPGASAPSNYGPRIDPITGGSQFHKGVDIATPVGTCTLDRAIDRIHDLDELGISLRR